jgi:hypothetical protein
MARMTAVDRLIDVPRQHVTERSLGRFNVTAVFGEAFGQSFDLAALHEHDRGIDRIG